MERELFTWTDCDGDWPEMIFFGIELKTRIGSYQHGYACASATVNYERGTLKLHDVKEDGTLTLLGEYKLHLVVDNIQEC